MRAGRDQLPVESEAKPARFIDHVLFMTGPEQSFHPGHELAGRESRDALGSN
jgi:hypothetical protein